MLQDPNARKVRGSRLTTEDGLVGIAMASRKHVGGADALGTRNTNFLCRAFWAICRTTLSFLSFNTQSANANENVEETRIKPIH
jgi:hypothetical protein